MEQEIGLSNKMKELMRQDKNSGILICVKPGGDYQIGDYILDSMPENQGAFSKVFFARCARNRVYEPIPSFVIKGAYGRRYADMSERMEELNQLRNERRILKKIGSHNNIMHIAEVFCAWRANRDTGEKEEFEFHVMDRARYTLWELLRNNMSMKTKMIVIQQLRDGLITIFKHGVVHLDLKPANIFIYGHYKSHDLTVRIGDFGLAEEYGHSGMIKCRDVFAGTPVYQPPYTLEEMETQMGSYMTVNFNIDLWSFSLIIHEIIFGRLPDDYYSSNIYNPLKAARELQKIGVNKDALGPSPSYFEELAVDFMNQVFKSDSVNPKILHHHQLFNLNSESFF